MHNVYSHQHIYSMCQKNMNQYVLVEMVDGQKLNGLLSGFDENYVYLDVPVQSQGQSDMRYGPGFGWYGYPGFGFGYPFWGWRRLVLPLTALVALTALAPLFFW